MEKPSFPSRRPAQIPGPNAPCWCGSGKKYKRCHLSLDGDLSSQLVIQKPIKRVRPGIISPRRDVPARIARPEYALSGLPIDKNSYELMNGERLERMREACAVAAQVLKYVGDAVKVGITTDELDALAHQEYIRLGAYPSTLNYHGYPKSICTSVNEVICHGIPDSRPLEDGDIVNLDVTAFFKGMHGDCSATFMVGKVDEESKRLVRATHECMMLGINAVKPGRPIKDIGKVIESHAAKNGFGVVRAYCGHGIGEKFHTSVQVPHYYEPGANQRMISGMTFTIEPMITAGTWEHRIWEDRWTAVTADGLRTAQFEHTILVTENGAEILTILPGIAP